jgi:hypothetical protein
MLGGASGSNANLVAAGPLLFHVLRASMRRISGRRAKLLSPLQPIRALRLRPPPGHTPAQSAGVLVHRRKKQRAKPAGRIQALGSPTTPPNQSTIRHLNQKPSTPQLRPPETLCVPPFPYMEAILVLKMHCTFASLRSTMQTCRLSHFLLDAVCLDKTKR